MNISKDIRDSSRESKDQINISSYINFGSNDASFIRPLTSKLTIPRKNLFYERQLAGHGQGLKSAVVSNGIRSQLGVKRPSSTFMLKMGHNYMRKKSSDGDKLFYVPQMPSQGTTQYKSQVTLYKQSNFPMRNFTKRD